MATNLHARSVRLSLTHAVVISLISPLVFRIKISWKRSIVNARWSDISLMKILICSIATAAVNFTSIRMLRREYSVQRIEKVIVEMAAMFMRCGADGYHLLNAIHYIIQFSPGQRYNKT